MPSNYEKYQEGFRNPDGYTSLEGMVGAQRRREFDNFLSRNPGSAAPQAQLKNDRPRRSASMATAKSAAKACALLCAIVFAAYGWSERGGTLVVALGYAMAGALLGGCAGFALYWAWVVLKFVMKIVLWCTGAALLLWGGYLLVHAS